MRRFALLAGLLTSLPIAALGAAPSGAPPATAPAAVAAQLADRDANRISDSLQAQLRAARPGDLFRVVVTWRQPASAAAAAQAIGAFSVHREFRIIPGFAGTMTAAQISALSQHPGVFRIEEDFTVRTQLDAARADFGADAARTRFGVNGAGIKGCIVDTGVDPNHEQLNRQPIPFFDAVNGATAPYDDQGHGTHVASIAFGDGTGGSSADRYRGVAPGVAIYAAKVLGADGSGAESQVISGIEWCVSQGVHIISMSLGTSAPSDGSDALSQAVDAAAAGGIAVVVAAGNSGDQPGSVGSPGAAAGAITVGACAERSAPVGSSNHSDGIYLASFSSRGPTLDGRAKPDVCAPGHSITAARMGTVSGYVAYSGTSMATPFVAGTVALGLQSRAMTPAGVRQLLEATAQDRGPAGKDNDWGAGLLDAYAFVARSAGVTDYVPTGFPTWRRVAASVGSSGLWTHSFDVAAADLAVPIAATITIDGEAKCTMSVLGLCFSAQWDPDLDARLYDPNGVLLADSNCLADDECGSIGRQETLHAMPTVAGTYTIQVFPAGDSGNNGKGGSFAVDLSAGPVGGASGGGSADPLVHVGGLAPSSTGSKSGWRASVTITLHDDQHRLFTPAATVSGTWSDGYAGNSSCVTSGGQCTVTSGQIQKRRTSARFTVDSVSGGVSYQPASNDATSVVVTKP